MMGDLPATIYTGEKFSADISVIDPVHCSDLAPLWMFCSSPAYREAVRRIDKSIKPTNTTLAKVPVNIDSWRAEAEAALQEGLPEPYSDDPTQWLFHGHPAHAKSGTELLVALLRIAGYRWPAETQLDLRLSNQARKLADRAATLASSVPDGLLTLHAYGSDRPLSDRIRALLGAAFGRFLDPAEEAQLVRAADVHLDRKEARENTLESWLRDRAFRQHCALFKQRPVVWQIWDGMRDGFSIFANCHKLDFAALERLTYTLLGDWITKVRADGRTANEDRALQLQQRLRAILDGETPFDIFTRWKHLRHQPVGWRPDLNDGIRVNIRPFILGEVLREQPRIHWHKDRGADPTSSPWHHLGLLYGGKAGDRINDHHLSLAEKRAVQSQVEAS
jgi:hypothetical protein